MVAASEMLFLSPFPHFLFENSVQKGKNSDPRFHHIKDNRPCDIITALTSRKRSLITEKMQERKFFLKRESGWKEGDLELSVLIIGLYGCFPVRSINIAFNCYSRRVFPTLEAIDRRFLLMDRVLRSIWYTSFPAAVTPFAERGKVNA